MAGYHILKTLQKETDEEEFVKCVDGFIGMMESNECYEDFREYFMNNYASNVEQWAACYRIRSGITTYNYIESFHSVYKKHYLKGKVNNRMDKCLNALLKYARDLLFKRARNLAKNAYLRKEKDIAIRHKLATSLAYEIVELNVNQWQVNTGTETEAAIEYVVKKNHDESPEKYHILCRACKTCLHLYECTCYDFLSASNMCKHIHYVLLKNTIPINQAQDCAIEVIDEFLPGNKSTVEKFTKDEELIKNLEILTSLVKIPDLGRNDQDANNLLAIVKSYIPLFSKPNEVSSEPHNKRAPTQMRFFHNKKRKTSKARLGNLTNEEVLEVKRSLKD